MYEFYSEESFERILFYSNFFTLNAICKCCGDGYFVVFFLLVSKTKLKCFF